MALPGLPWSLSVCYDFAIGVVTNIIAAAILDSKAPSLLDDFDKDEAGNKDDSDSESEYRWKNYPQEALNWLENQNGDGEESNVRRTKDQSRSEGSEKRPSKEMIRSHLENGPDTTIIEASKNGHIEIVKVMIEKGLDINTLDDVGYTALSYAALNGYLDVVDLLIEYGADVNVTNHWGGNALVQAAFFGHVDIAKILIDNGANMNVTIHGDSLVVYAAKNGFDDLVEHLINAGATYKYSKEKLCNGGGEKKTSIFKKWKTKLKNGRKRS